MLLLRHGDILPGHFALQFDGAAHRLDGAGKLDQHAVAGGLDEVAAMRGEGGLDKRLSDGLQPGQRALVIVPHQAAVVGDVRRQHRRKPPLHALARQGKPQSVYSSQRHQSMAASCRTGNFRQGFAGPHSSRTL